MNCAVNYGKTYQKFTNAAIPRAAYVHIPFCRRRCYYCDFAVSVVGDRKHGGNSNTIAQYVDILLEEISITPGFCQPLETIFFGGGTPSLLTVGQLEIILATLDRQFGIATDAEISMEIDPGTFTKEQLQGYLAAGVNRVSLGVQAFQDALLAVCGRSHTSQDIFTAIDLLQQLEVTNFSIDLISGLPHQTLTDWEYSLKSALTIAPAHISSYDLIVEPKTPFDRYYQPGISPLPSEETTALMYRLAQQMLTTSGYQHYEISNYALPGYQCRHNRIYWQNLAYYGFGMGAASYLFRQRFTRPRITTEYYQWVKDTKAAIAIGKPNQIIIPDSDISDISDISGYSDFHQDLLLETIMLGLRLAEGLNISKLITEFGAEILKKIWKTLQPYYQQGWVEILDNNGLPIRVNSGENIAAYSQIRLTDPEGFLFSNTILSTLFSKLGETE